MTIPERIADAQRRSVQAYLQRVRIQEQMGQAQAHAAALDRELLALDGEVRVLTAMGDEKDGA